MSLYRRAASRVRASASGAIRPVRSTPCPSRTTSIRRSRSTSVPASGSTSATSSRIELVPQSMAATRVTRPSSHRTTHPTRNVRGRGCSSAQFLGRPDTQQRPRTWLLSAHMLGRPRIGSSGRAIVRTLPQGSGDVRRIGRRDARSCGRPSTSAARSADVGIRLGRCGGWGGQQVQRSGRHSSRIRVRASSPIGLTPGPAASACPTSTCRHFTRVGMPPAEMPAISSTCPSASRSTR